MWYLVVMSMIEMCKDGVLVESPDSVDNLALSMVAIPSSIVIEKTHN